MFFNCSSLKSIDLSLINLSNINKMNLLFKGYSSLKSIDLSSMIQEMLMIFMVCFMDVQH